MVISIAPDPRVRIIPLILIIVPENCVAIDSPVAGSVWQLLVKEGDQVQEDQTLAVLESMKMEIEITAPHAGIIYAITRSEGQQVNAGQALLILQEQ